MLSLFGIFFLFSVGNMFATQPMFTDVEVWAEDHDHDAAVNCYIGGALYVATLVVSPASFLRATQNCLPTSVPPTYNSSPGMLDAWMFLSTPKLP